MPVDFGGAPLVFVRKLSKRLRRRALTGVVLSLFAVTLAAAAQLPSVLPKPPAPAPTTQEQVSDPLGRSTPRGTIRGFVKAADRNDFVTAVQYLQVSGKPTGETETLARELKELMNRYFSRPLALISDSPEGEVQEALPFDHERIGSFKTNDKTVDVVVVHVSDPRSGRIWLISSDTLAKVPALFETIEANWVDRFMPNLLLDHSLFSISLAQWTIWFASIALPLLFFYFFAHITLAILMRRVRNEKRRTLVESWYKAIRWPAVFILTVTVNLLVMMTLGLSLTYRILYGRSMLVLLIIGLAWLLRRTTTLSFERVRATMQQSGDTGEQSLILLAERLLRVVIILVAIFAILSIVGVDTKTALAGLGIGGVAIAFGAQKTVENLLGGIFLLTDKALAIGDKCSIGGRVGTVEDITLRSVRLRTPEQTMLSIPAGTLSQSNIENFATRSKIPVATTLELRYGTTAEQLKSILDKIRRILAEHPRTETATARVQLISYGPNSIQLELFAYVTTRDEAEFRTVREDVLLQIGEVVDHSGGGFAIPAQRLYIEPRSEPRPERTSVLGIRGPEGNDQEASRDPERTSSTQISSERSSQVPRSLSSSLPAEHQVLPKRAS